MRTECQVSLKSQLQACLHSVATIEIIACGNMDTMFPVYKLPWATKWQSYNMQEADAITDFIA